MSDLPVLDSPPRNGVWNEHNDLILTDQEAEAGNQLGVQIDVGNDEDNGL